MSLGQKQEAALRIGKEFEPYIIKKYPSGNWALVLNPKQVPYVGRCVAWWLDHCPGEGERMTPHDLPRAERDELFEEIWGDAVKACQALGYNTEPYGKDFLLNMAYLANEEGHNHHMHWHFVPRTRVPLRVEALLGQIFEDIAWGQNYASIRQRPLDGPDEALIIRDTMAEAIGGIVH